MRPERFCTTCGAPPRKRNFSPSATGKPQASSAAVTELWAAIAASNPGKRAAGNTEQKLAKGLQMWTDFFDHSIQPGVIARPNCETPDLAAEGCSLETITA